MQDYKVKQLQPNHADHISYYKQDYISSMLESEPVIAQPKYDGERMLIHINNGEVYCTSRRFSKKTDRYMENQDKLPILQEVCKDFSLGYTVIDCEAYAKDWSTAVGILHSLPERAIELQKQDTLHFAVFDCLFFNGEDIRNQPYISRLHKAYQVVQSLNYEPLHLVKIMRSSEVSYDVDDIQNVSFVNKYDEIEEIMNRAIHFGFEGIVLKSLMRAYYDVGASLKCKKFETVDCVVCGYQQGRGKYENSVGALEIGYYDSEQDKVIQISRVNCGSDVEREMWNQNREKMLNSVIEVKCQEVTDRSLRHPVYVRLREDKDYKMCTKSTIFKEC